MGLGLALGLCLGLFAEPLALALGPVGGAFLDLLKLLVLPLTFCAMVSGVTRIAGGGRLGRTSGLALAFFLGTSLFASALGLGLVNLLLPGRGYPVAAAAVPPPLADRPVPGLDTLLGVFIQPNLVQAAAEMQLLPLLLFALALGASLRGLGDEGRAAAAFFEAMNAALTRMVGWLLALAPVGLGALVAHQLAQAGGWAGLSALVSSLLGWMSTVLLGLGLQALLLLMLLRLLAPARARDLPPRMLPALLTAFSTGSSVATMPVTLTAVEGAGVRPAGARLVVPLGTTLNMNGTALYEAMAALFIAQAYGIVLDPAAQAVVVLLASLAAVGAAGIPEAGLVTMVVVLTTVGLPVEGIGLLLTIDWLLDRFRTMVNVLGDGVAAAVVDAALEGRPSPGAAEDPEPKA
jgi:Na+/H+-dicarboxylate symporter